MLDTISQQKINSYEQELEIQRTQMQCLQLQIRPHFFLNCLSKIYSLAGEKQFSPIQELSLDLSAYFRNIFKDGSQPVSYTHLPMTVIAIRTELEGRSAVLTFTLPPA